MIQLLDSKKQRSEALLQNSLPADIAKRLSTGEEPVVDEHESISVLFADLDMMLKEFVLTATTRRSRNYNHGAKFKEMTGSFVDKCALRMSGDWPYFSLNRKINLKFKVLPKIQFGERPEKGIADS